MILLSKHKSRYAVWLLFTLLSIATALAFDSHLTYVGQNRLNSSGAKWNGNYTIVTYMFTSAACSGTPFFSESADAEIINGNFVVLVNYTPSYSNFWLKPSISGNNQSCFKYTSSPQADVANNATNSKKLNGFESSSLPIAGDVTGTLGSSTVSVLDLDAVAYSGLLGFNNLTKCSSSQILKMSGTSWVCDSDSSGSNSDISDWTAHDNYPTACSAGQVVTGIGDSLTCSADGNITVSSIQFTGLIFTLEQQTFSGTKLSNLTATINPSIFNVNYSTSAGDLICDNCIGSTEIVTDNTGDCGSGNVCGGGHSHSEKANLAGGETFTGNETFQATIANASVIRVNSTNRWVISANATGSLVFRYE